MEQNNHIDFSLIENDLQNTINNFAKKHNLEFNHIVHFANFIKKQYKTVKNQTKAESFSRLQAKDLSGTEIRILEALLVCDYLGATRKELSKLTGIEIETLTGIIANSLLKFGYVEVDEKKRCTITNNKVEKLVITRLGQKYLRGLN
ncbi:hypothetical protein [Leptospira bandrabouensis]|uniref:hypothetical protein n=1 Tax=Leptospira bandrabouensis TaxID=2484903 RepID=UPI0010917FFD|nr:hypothetical protein [Leptospira bandrabouensis]TGN03618.1 hypothetical protein EHR07_17445 [Leptospira bandrabouensis]